jgi:hypothetical protein
MKKTYAAPTAISSGDVVRQTLGGKANDLEVEAGGAFRPGGGSVGFYL